MKRDLNCPHIFRSSQNALNLLHFLRRFDIIRKHGKLVWLSRQSDSLVMNRSAVRIRPPAPQKPARLSGFPCSPWAYSYRSLTQVYPTRKSQIFPRGTPTSPARLRSQIRCAACAIPSRSRSLRIRPPAPHSRKASIAAPRKVLRGVCVFTPAENQRFSPGDPDFACGCVYASQKYGRSPRSSFLCVAPKLSRCSLIFASRFGRLAPPSFMRISGFPCSPWAYSYLFDGANLLHGQNQRLPAGTRALLAGIFGRVRCWDEKARGVPRAFALPDRASQRRNLKEHIGFVAAAATTAVFVVLYRQSVSAV